MENERSSIDLDAKNFENLKYDPSKSTRDIILGNSCDPDLNFYNIIKNINTPNIVPENIHTFLDDSLSESFSNLLLNIRSSEQKL